MDTERYPDMVIALTLTFLGAKKSATCVGPHEIFNFLPKAQGLVEAGRRQHLDISHTHPATCDKQSSESSRHRSVSIVGSEKVFVGGSKQNSHATKSYWRVQVHSNFSGRVGR